MTKIFKDLIGKHINVYVDDLVVDSKDVESHWQHLKEIFNILHNYQVKLNPDKCTFGVTSEKFLGYLVTKRGIESTQIISMLF